jgi:hypothetical protein
VHKGRSLLFAAYDEVVSGVVPLTSAVVLGDVTPIARTDRHITFVVPYSVVDSAGMNKCAVLYPYDPYPNDPYPYNLSHCWLNKTMYSWLWSR